MSRHLVLINSNIVKPPVSPVGLEYVAESLSRAGFEVDIIDLAVEKDWRQAISSRIPAEPLVVGMTLRNTDDCSFYSRKYFIPWAGELVQEVRKHTDAPTGPGRVGEDSEGRGVNFIFDLLIGGAGETGAGDPRFLLLAEPGGKGSYNYAGDQFLYDEILKGRSRGLLGHTCQS